MTLRYVLAVLLACCSLASAQDDADFVPLFNGKDLAGWEGDPRFWSVRDGAITGETTPQNPTRGNTFLIWRGGKVADFELRAKYRIAGENNSGIQYRSKELPNFVVTGYQADLDTARKYAGMLYEEGKGNRGIVATRGQKVIVRPDGKKDVIGETGDAAELLDAIKPDDWNEYVITAIGNHLVHKVNGRITAEITDEQADKRSMEGIVALQVHAGKPMTIQFKDIQLKVIKPAGSATQPATTQAAAASTGDGPTPKWIWRGRRTRDGEVAFFRKSVTLKGEPSMARIVATGDDAFELFVNGASVAKSAGIANEWQRPISVDVSKRLTSGHNAIAVRCVNRHGPAGLLLKFETELSNGRRVTTVSDASWVASSSEKPGWNRQDYSAAGGWSAAQVIGEAGIEPWGEIAGLEGPGATIAAATPAEKLRLLPGFKAELLYSVPKAREGSWVSMCFDDNGRIIASDQSTTLFRVTLPKDGAPLTVDPLNVEIGQAQGLLYHNNSLYVNVNGSAAQGSGFYRVRDTDGDDQFDEVKLLKKFKGGGEHGPHAIRLGPDGKLYILNGNHTDLPDGILPTSPHKNYQEDLLLPRQPDAGGHATGRMAPGGYILRTDLDGGEWDLFCGGFRNAYDMDFNPDGELFAFDADMEWDIGLPWYRPTRVNHCISGAEFGWRYGSGKWPAYYADSMGGYDVGIGSPTGVTFGTGAKFPAKYQRALFILDWSYGTIHAMHLTPAGSTYTATFEPFVAGKPLPLTDIAIGPDGAMYFTIGGRNTQSGLYRVTYMGDESKAPAEALVDAAAAEAREQRRKLEAFHGRAHPDAIDAAWPHLGSPDRAMRNAARVAIEWQEPAAWADRALSETNPAAAITALCALARTGPPSIQSRLLDALDRLNFTALTEPAQLDVLRVYQLAFLRMGKPDAQTRSRVAGKFEPLFPASSFFLNRELCQLLVYVESPQVVARAMQLIATSSIQEEQVEFVFQLRSARVGWDEPLRRRYFEWFNTRAPLYSGGNSFKGYLKNTRADAERTLSDEERVALADVLKARPVTPAAAAVAPTTARPFVKEWTMQDLLPRLDQVEHGRSFRKGREAFVAVGCNTCHKFATQSADVGLGPDITGVGNRFSPADLLESILEPSKTVSDLYMTTEIRTADDVLTGRIESDNGKEVVIRINPLMPPVKVAAEDIKSRRPSPISTMPKSLLDNLTEEEILDLLAYLRAAGNPNDIAFQR